MIQSEPQVHIKNLRLRNSIGFNKSEINNKKDTTINIWAHYPAPDTDNVENTANNINLYKKMIVHTASKRTLLPKTRAAPLLALCMAQSNNTYTKVEIAKPHSLHYADYVPLTLSANREK